jgi:Uma2 family endonuclease
MPTSTAVSVEEYLSTDYSPDREYVDGAVVERNLGERSHSRLQTLVSGYILAREREWRVVALTEQRVQVKATRFRIPDICVLAEGDPNEQIVRHPPIVCIEILSRDDRMSAMKDRIADYLAMGVRHIWFLDPVAGNAFDATKEGVREVNEDTLRAAETQIALPIAELFRQLQNR